MFLTEKIQNLYYTKIKHCFKCFILFYHIGNVKICRPMPIFITISKNKHIKFG